MTRPAKTSPLEDTPARRERNATETRKRLLDAAEAEFASKGFAGVRLREVAQAAGVQQALIHHYFEDKEGLYRAVLDRAIEQTAEVSWAILGKATSIEGLIEAFVGMLLEFYGMHANLVAMLRMEVLTGSTMVADVIQPRSRPIFEAAEALLTGFQKRGTLRADVRPADLITSVLAMTLFPSLEAPLLGALWPALQRPLPDLEERKRTTVALVLRGLLPDPRPA